MATGTRQPNTMEELLRKQLSSLSDLFLADDADFDYITKLQAAIVGKLREPIDSVAQQGLTQAPPSLAVGMEGGGMQAPDMMGSAMPTPSPSPLPGGMGLRGGLNPSPAMPSPDELRRVITQGQ